MAVSSPRPGTNAPARNEASSSRTLRSITAQSGAISMRTRVVERARHAPRLVMITASGAKSATGVRAVPPRPQRPDSVVLTPERRPTAPVTGQSVMPRSLSDVSVVSWTSRHRSSSRQDRSGRPFRSGTCTMGGPTRRSPQPVSTQSVGSIVISGLSRTSLPMSRFPRARSAPCSGR